MDKPTVFYLGICTGVLLAFLSRLAKDVRELKEKTADGT